MKKPAKKNCVYFMEEKIGGRWATLRMTTFFDSRRANNTLSAWMKVYPNDKFRITKYEAVR